MVFLPIYNNVKLDVYKSNFEQVDPVILNIMYWGNECLHYT